MRIRPFRRLGTKSGQEGFSMLELLVSVAIITLLMAIVFQFLSINQQRYRSQQLLAEVSQGGRSAFEVMTQELNQAGSRVVGVWFIGVDGHLGRRIALGHQPSCRDPRDAVSDYK